MINEIKPIKFSDLPKNLSYEASEDFTIFFVNNGSLIVDIAFEKRTVGAGKIFLVGPNIVFSVWANHKGLKGHQIKISARLWKKHSPKEYEFMLIPQTPLMREITLYPDRNEDYLNLSIPLMIKLLDTEMKERCLPKGTNFKPLSFFLHPKIDKRVLNACEFILKNYADPDLRIDSLAKASGVSARNMQRLFLSSFGMGPLEAIKRVRIENALYLLSSSDLSLSSIGLEVGYQSHSQFIKAFKSLMGKPPSETALRK
jgi:AraC-like DNA-binding protein